MTEPPLPAEKATRSRIRLFVDFWNFQLTLNEKERLGIGQTDVRFPIDWLAFPKVAVGKAAAILDVVDFSYEGTIVYVSYNPRSSEDRSFHNWLTTWLDRQPGIQVVVRERQPKAPVRCPTCHQPITVCPHCQTFMKPTSEKGIDTAIVTDMIRLAWEDAHDVSVVVSSDRDLVPAVQFLDLKGRKTIQAGFPPWGVDLATACWASFDLFPLRDQFRRT